MASPTYTFTKKPVPTEPNQQSNFGNAQRDGSKQPMFGYLGNGIQTTDATASPNSSPLTVASNSVQVLTIPVNAASVTITATAFTLFVSEVGTAAASSLTSYDIIPVGATKTYNVGNQYYLYVLGGTGSCVASFYFDII
jgi:hypothetical protein